MFPGLHVPMHRRKSNLLRLIGTRCNMPKLPSELVSMTPNNRGTSVAGTPIIRSNLAEPVNCQVTSTLKRQFTSLQMAPESMLKGNGTQT